MLPLFLSAAALASAPETPKPLPVVSVQGTPVYVDRSNDVWVRFVELPTGNVYFSSQMPAGWAFSVDVDGDQNGEWGRGTGMPDPSVTSSSDYSFGQDSRNGVFCSQYVFTHWEKDPSSTYVSSDCGSPKSNGHVIISGFDGKMRATVLFEIPSDEFFQNRASARIEVCVWDTKKTVCQHRIPDLLELKREFPTAVTPNAR